MTVGTRNIIIPWKTDSHPAWVGPLYSYDYKNWSGSDSPGVHTPYVEKRYETVVKPPVYRFVRKRISELSVVERAWVLRNLHVAFHGNRNSRDAALFGLNRDSAPKALLRKAFFRLQKVTVRVPKLVKPGLEYKRRVGYSSPPRRVLKRSVANPYSAAGHRYRQDNFKVGDPGGSYDYGRLSNLVNNTDIWTSNDDLKLLSKLRDKVAGSSFHAGVAGAEISKTFDMVRKTVFRLSKAITATRKGNFKYASEILLKDGVGKRRAPKGSTAAANNWLELQYGWLPLINDVREGAQFIGYMSGAPTTLRVVVTREVRASGEVDLTSGIGFIVYGNRIQRSSKRIIAEISEINVPTLSGYDDTLSIMWERLPYSFIFDWFVPLGSYLSARSLNQALTGKYVTSKTVATTAGFPYRIEGIKGYHYDRFIEKPSGYFSESWSFDRTLSTSLNIPLPSMKTLGQAASWQHTANAIALFVGMKGNSPNPNSP